MSNFKQVFQTVPILATIEALTPTEIGHKLYPRYREALMTDIAEYLINRHNYNDELVVVFNQEDGIDGVQHSMFLLQEHFDEALEICLASMEETAEVLQELKQMQPHEKTGIHAALKRLEKKWI